MLYLHTIKRTHIELFFGLIIISIILFFLAIYLLLAPKINTAFNTVSTASKELDAKLYANQLSHYIKGQESSLKNIANTTLSTSFFTRNSSLDEFDENAIKELTSQFHTLEKGTSFTLLNTKGNIIYSERTANSSPPKTLYQWALPLLTDTTKHAYINIPKDKPLEFEFALPIIHKQKKKGILITNISAKPSDIYKNSDTLDSNISIDYAIEKPNITKQSGNHRFEKSILLSPYSLYFIYSDNRDLSSENNKGVINAITILLISTFIIVLICWLIARRFVIKHHHNFTCIQQATSSMIEGMSTIDIENNYISVNNAYMEMTGYSMEELVGKPASMTIHPEDRELVQHALTKTKAQNSSSIVVRGLRKDGSLFFKRMTMVDQHDVKGSVICHHRFSQDISSEKEHEEKIKQQQHELQLIFDNVPIKIWYKDDKNKIIRLNKQAAQSMGGTQKDFEGKDTYDLFPEMAKKYHNDDLAVIRSKQPLLNIIEEYTPLCGKDTKRDKNSQANQK